MHLRIPYKILIVCPTNIAVVHALLLIIITTKIVVDNKLVISTSLMSKGSFPLSI